MSSRQPWLPLECNCLQRLEIGPGKMHRRLCNHRVKGIGWDSTRRLSAQDHSTTAAEPCPGSEGCIGCKPSACHLGCPHCMLAVTGLCGFAEALQSLHCTCEHLLQRCCHCVGKAYHQAGETDIAVIAWCLAEALSISAQEKRVTIYA